MVVARHNWLINMKEHNSKKILLSVIKIYFDFKYKSRIKLTIFSIIEMFLLQIIVYILLFGTDDVYDSSVIIVSIVFGLMCGIFCFELEKYKKSKIKSKNNL